MGQLPAQLPTWLLAPPGAVVWWRKSKKTPENGVTPIAETLSRSFVKRGAKSLFHASAGHLQCISMARVVNRNYLLSLLTFHRFKALFLSVVALSLAFPFFTITIFLHLNRNFFI